MDHDEAERLRARLVGIIESSDDAIVSKDLNGIISTWNQGAERLFGYRAEEAVGRPVTMLIPPERIDEEPEILARIRRGERIDHYETVRRRKDGSLVDISLTVSPIFDGSRRVIGASKIARDISDRKAAESALRENDRRKDEFLATLAHELRNPLAPLKNAIELLLLRGSTDPEQQELQQMMERQVGHLNRLVDDLLELSRISSGKIELVREEVPLANILRHAVETSQPLIDAGRHLLDVQVPINPLMVHADAVRLAQVFANLLNNAAKYMEPGGSITVRVVRKENSAVISVGDTGIGIAADELPYVFDMFAQARSVQKRVQSGLGIGLSLVRKLIELHGGTVAARSAGPGMGSEFVVTLPCVPSGPAPVYRSGPSLPNLTGVTVLIVDDNRDAAQSLATLLRALGAEAHLAFDGEAALKAIRHKPPAYAVLDIGMPGMDGYQLGAKIIGERHPTILIALTGWGQEEDRRRSKEAGFHHHLVKPVDAKQLLSILAGS